MGWQDDPVVDNKPAPAPAESAGVSAVAGWQSDPVVADPYGGGGDVATADAIPADTIGLPDTLPDTPPDTQRGFTNISQGGRDFLGSQAQKATDDSFKAQANIDYQQAKRNVQQPEAMPDDRTALGTLARSTVGGLASGAQSVGGTLVRAGGALPGIAAGLMSDLVLPAGPIKDAVDKWATNRLSQAKDAGNFVLDNAADTMKRVEGQNKGAPLGWMGTRLAGVASSGPALLAGDAAPAVFALEAAAKADKAADEKGVTGFDKASNVVLQAVIAATTGHLMKALGGAGAQIERGAVAEALNGLKSTTKDLFTMKLLTHAANQITEQGDKPMSSWGELADLLGNSAVDTAIESGLLTAGGVAAKGIGHMAGSETTTNLLDKAGLPNDRDLPRQGVVGTDQFTPNAERDAAGVENTVRDNLRQAGVDPNASPDSKVTPLNVGAEPQGPTEGLPHDEFDKTINSIPHPDQPLLDQFGLGAVPEQGKVDSGAETHVPGEKDATPVNERDFTKATSVQPDFAQEFEEQPPAVKRSGTYTFEDTETGEKITAKGEEEARKLIQEKANAEADKRGAQGDGLPEDVRSAAGAGDAEAERGSAEPAAEAAAGERAAAAGEPQSGAGDQGVDAQAGVEPTPDELFKQRLAEKVAQVQAMEKVLGRRPTRDEVMRRVKGVPSSENAGQLIQHALGAPLKLKSFMQRKAPSDSQIAPMGEFTPDEGAQHLREQALVNEFERNQSVKKPEIPQIAPKVEPPETLDEEIKPQRAAKELKQAFMKRKMVEDRRVEAINDAENRKRAFRLKEKENAPQAQETPSKAVPATTPDEGPTEFSSGGKLPEHLLEGANVLLKEAKKAVKGESLPETSAKSEVAADAVAAHAAATGGAAGEWLGKRWKNSVIDKGASEAERKEIGAALVEQRLRFDKAQGRKDTPTMVGEGRPFATEQDYQDALKSPQVQDAIARIKASVQPEKTALFAKSEGYEAGDALPPEYDGRISLIRADGEPDESPTKVTGGAVRVRSNFGKSAKGTDWTAYETDVGKILDGMASESMKASTNKTMLDTLMKENLASFKDSKDRDIIKVNYPVRHTDKNGKAYIKTEELPLYVDKAIAPEVLKAMHKDEKSRVPAFMQTAGKGINAINTSGLALPLTIAGVSGESEGWKGKAYNILSAASPEFTTHAVKSVLTIATQNGGFKNAAMDLARTSGLNVFHALYGIGHAANDIAKSDPKVQAEMEKLANIGSLRPGSHGLISHVENASRLVMSRMFDNLVARGLREDTPTIRREFVNQLGQYTPGMQSDFVRVLKHLGVGPFAVAGTTGARVGAKSLLGISAGKSNAPITESGLQITRNLVLAAATSAALRAIIWKGREDDMPKGGTWDVPLPWRDGKGKYYNMDLLGTSMAARGMRTIGLGAGLEAKRQGLPMSMVADKAITSAGNALTMPMMGPVPQAAAVLATGKDIGFGQGFRKAKTAKPGESQYVENWKAMLKQMDPSVANTMDALDEESAGKDTWENKAVQAIGRPFGLRTKADK